MKRGFTLVELLCAIIVLGIIVVIIIPSIQKYFTNSSKKILEKQIESIENIARTWGSQNTGKLDNCYILQLEELKKSGFLENTDIINPETEEELDGCVKISFDESINQYIYNYTETNFCNCTGN